ncbi:Aldo/keto reductase [Apiospora arundinis]
MAEDIAHNVVVYSVLAAFGLIGFEPDPDKRFVHYLLLEGSRVKVRHRSIFFISPARKNPTSLRVYQPLSCEIITSRDFPCTNVGDHGGGVVTFCPKRCIHVMKTDNLRWHREASVHHIRAEALVVELMARLAIRPNYKQHGHRISEHAGEAQRAGNTDERGRETLPMNKKMTCFEVCE